MRWPLRYQILLPFAGVMLAVVLGVSLLDAYLAARRTQRRIEDQLRSVAGTLSESNFPLTDAVLKQTRGLSGAEFVLCDAQGRVQGGSMMGIELPKAAQDAAAGEFSLGQPIELSGQRYFHTVIPVRAPGTQSEPMWLHILYPERFLREARWQAAYPPLVVGSVLLCVVVVLSVAIGARLSRPILELRRQLSGLVQGDFQPVPLPQRNDELRDLIGSVNLLGDQLEELRRVIKRTERLALVGQLSGGLAHQLRNSVTGARLAVQLHQRHCRDIDPDSLTVALRQLSITEAHLQCFLTVGRPTAPRRSHCDMCQILREVASLVGPACHHRNVKLQAAPLGTSATDGCLGTPRTPADQEILQPVELWADADQLRQLFLNLLLNGIEAAGSDGWVRVELGSDNDQCRVRVLDSGPGPSMEVAQRLFEPFATAKSEGVGLGLTVAKTIVELHGGTIRFAGTAPTCFEVVLPRETPRETPDGSCDPVEFALRAGKAASSVNAAIAPVRSTTQTSPISTSSRV